MDYNQEEMKAWLADPRAKAVYRKFHKEWIMKAEQDFWNRAQSQSLTVEQRALDSQGTLNYVKGVRDCMSILEMYFKPEDEENGK